MIRRLQDGLLVALGSLALIAVIAIALAHLSDRMRSDHVAGAWMALTRYAEDGILYPPLFDGQRYGGTRFMPLSILVNLAFAQLSDDLIFTGKLASLVSVVVVLGLTYRLLRACAVDRPLAVGLVGLVSTTEPMLVMAWAPFRGDGPALALQLGALLLVLQRPRWRFVGVVAGVLAALAVASKASAGWAPMSIGLFWLVTDRRQLVRFVATFFAVVVASLTAAELISHGAFSENILGLSAEQVDLRRLAGALGRILFIVESVVQPLWLLLPVAGLAVFSAAVRGRFALHHLAFAASGLAAWIMFADPGVSSNHLVDLAILCVVCVGGLAVRTREVPALRSLFVALVLWGTISGIDLGITDRVKELVKGAPQYELDVYDRLASEGQSLLSEDPTVPVRVGQHPLVLDSYMWRRMTVRDPALSEPLLRRIRAGDIDRVILLKRPRDGLEEGWYRDMHFGSEAIEAVLARYTLVDTVQGYWVYEPTPTVDTSSTAR